MILNDREFMTLNKINERAYKEAEKYLEYIQDPEVEKMPKEILQIFRRAFVSGYKTSCIDFLQQNMQKEK